MLQSGRREFDGRLFEGSRKYRTALRLSDCLSLPLRHSGESRSPSSVTAGRRGRMDPGFRRGGGEEGYDDNSDYLKLGCEMAESRTSKRALERRPTQARGKAHAR